jgi:hypothetical protein
MNPLPHAPRQHEPSDPTPTPCDVIVGNHRTASTPAPLKGSLTQLRVRRRSTGLSKRAPEGQFHPRRDRPEPSALNRARPRPHVPSKGAETTKRPLRVVRCLRAFRNRFAGDWSVAFRVGVITSDKGYVNRKFAEVNNLVRNISEKPGRPKTVIKIFPF